MSDSTPSQTKEILLSYLDTQRGSLLWKVEGLDEGQLRRPMTGTGTNLLGLVKHLTAVEYGYFQMSFGRPYPDLENLRTDADRNLDFYATAQERADEIIQGYRDAIAASRQTCAELDLDAVAQVPWWQEPTTLERLVVHVTVETARHLGHADIVREQIDGKAGLTATNDNMWGQGTEFWEEHLTRLRTLAKQAEVGALDAVAQNPKEDQN